MTVQNLWPLAFLILVPVIILLYLLKQKVRDELFSSTMLWQEIYKNLEAKTPFEKLKQNILMYLQILLMLLLIFALMAPTLKKGGALQENIVLVIDNSASMQYLYDDKDSRLTHSIKSAERVMDGLSEDASVTLISCGEEAEVIYQGKDKGTLKKRLNAIEPTLGAGNLNAAANLVNSLITDLKNVQIICYTDTAFASEELTKYNRDAALVVEDMYSTGENCSLDYVNYSVNDEGVQALCNVTNYGETDVTQDVSLYAGSGIVDVQTVTVAAGESQTIYFPALNLATDGSVILTAELSEKDSLIADNSQSIVVTASMEKRVLLLSEGNVFLEKALSLEDTMTVYKSDSIGVLNQQEDPFDLYVFDGIKLPEDFDITVIPEQAALLFLNYSEDFYESGYMAKDGNVTSSVLHFEKSPVTEYVDGYSFGIAAAYTYQLPEWGIPFIKNDAGEIVGYCGVKDGRGVGVIGFDIHDTDLALQTEFPIVMSQLGDYLLGSTAETEEIINFPAGEESNVTPVESMSIEGTHTGTRAGGRAIRNFLLMLVIVVLLIEWIVYVRQVYSAKKKQFLAVRLLVLLTVILAMAGVSISQKQKRTETIFLVDISDSMKDNLEEMEQYLRQTVSDMPEKNYVGIVAFGKDTAVDQFLSDKKIFSGFTAAPVTTATNIERAVTGACSMFDEGVAKRLVLVTDGAENEGNMSIAAAALKGSDVELLSIAMEDSISGNSEVYIDGVTVPSVIHAGDYYNVTVSVTANIETNAVLSLYAGRTMKGQQQIHLTKGNNQFVFEDVGEEGTIAQYRAVIEPDVDTVSVNNSYVTFAEIEARPKILLVEGKAGEGSEFEKVLEAAGMDYDRVTPKGTPTALSALNQYKAVITLDVYYDDLREGFVNALQSYVKDYAGGYACIGGENSYALGNYRDTVLEEILPVDMDLQGEKEIPKMAMVMVIDQSGSMTSPSADNSSITGLDLAKQAAISGVSEVRETDEVGVLAFDDKYNWVVPVTQADDIDEIESAIRSIGYGGGTSIYPALEQAYQQILNSDAMLKHIILLTDGQDSYDGYDQLLEEINAAGITVSTVAVGSDSDQNMLSNIAETCGGRFYYTDVNNSIPRIFAQEVYLSTNTYLINEEFYPTITSNSEILSDVMTDGCPALWGYIAATPKQTADVILESHRKDPILSTWQYGLGRTVAWNSDGNNEWTAQYADWDKYPLLWSNILNYIISDMELGEDHLEVQKEGNSVVIRYETPEYDTDTSVSAVVMGEDGTGNEIRLNAVKPGVFEATVDIDEVGIYSMNIRKSSGEEILKNYNTAYANQYSAEYQFANAAMDYTSFIRQAGGKEITFADNIWEEKQEMVKAKTSLTVPLLILAMLLFLFDIIIRRFSIDMLGYVRNGWNAVSGLAAAQRERFGKKNAGDASKRMDVEKLQKAKSGQEIGYQTEQSKDNVTEEEKRKNVVAGISRKQDKKEHKTQTDDNQNEKLDMNQLLQKKRERDR